MGPFFLCRCASWHRFCLIAAASALLLPAVSRADPVADLRAALKLNPFAEAGKPDLELAAKRNKLIETAIPKLHTVSQLRQAYFLNWTQSVLPEKVDKILLVEKYRLDIGVRLTKAIRSAAKTNVDRQLAVAMLIAEIADSEKLEGTEKFVFVRTLTDVVRGLTEESDLPTRQAALSALGKITPDPAEAFPLLTGTLQKDELGPRRLAAYALTDLVKNARHLERGEKLKTIVQVVNTAAGDPKGKYALGDADERVRGYCLQAIQESVKASAGFVPSKEDPNTEGKKTATKDLQEILKTYQEINPQLLQALADKKLKVRLTALQTLEQIGSTRAKILQTIQEIHPDKPAKSDELLKLFGAPDPIAGIIAKLEKITPLLKEKDVRLRRGVIDFLEMLGDQAAPAIEGITDALDDEDRFVRWSAARTIRHLPEKAGIKAVYALMKMLIDPDPHLSASAAKAIEALGPDASDAVDHLAKIIANVEINSRPPDTELRILAMKALVSIGGVSAQKAFREVLSALGDRDDVRVRRQAAETLGQLGRPADPELARQAIAALRKALSDEDVEVRLNASEAILSIAATK